jgi:hypothetical protein
VLVCVSLLHQTTVMKRMLRQKIINTLGFKKCEYIIDTDDKSIVLAATL